jgi:hypothetical protein
MLMAQPHLIRSDSDRIAGRTIDFHILSAKRPDPRRLNHRLRMWIRQYHRRIVIYIWIKVRLVMIHHSRNRQRRLAVEFDVPARRELAAVRCE